MSNTISTLDAISKLILMGEDENSNYRWINEAVQKYLEDKKVSEVELLSEEDRNSLLEVLKMGFVDKDQSLPDYLVEKTDISVGEVPEEVVITEKEQQVEEVVKPPVQKSEGELLAELDKANKRLEVAKDFLKDLDTRLVKYESLDVDGLIALLDKYESIGTPEDILDAISKLESQEVDEEIIDNDKSESKDCEDSESEESDDAKGSDESEDDKYEEESEDNEPNESDEDEANEKSESGTSVEIESTKHEGDEMTDQVKHEEAQNTELEDMKKLLDRYQALGTPEEIEELVKRSEEMLDENSEMAGKMESMQADLEKYESIGEADEILDVITQFAEIKEKAESERIATALDIPVEKVRSTIAKLESISDAEELLTQLFAKTESEEDEVEEVEQEEVAPKTESADEAAEVVEEQKEKSEAERMTKLRQLCAKL